MLQKISSLDEINKGVILYDNSDEQKANRFSILEIHENSIRVIQTETKNRLRIFLINKLLSEDWWIVENNIH